MALIKCAECGHEVSDTTESCPNCGNILKNKIANALKRSTLAKVLCDISCIASLFIVFGFVIPLLWSFSFYIYYKNADGRIYDIQWYKKQAKESLVSFVIVLAIQVIIFGFIHYFLK